MTPSRQSRYLGHYLVDAARDAGRKSVDELDIETLHDPEATSAAAWDAVARAYSISPDELAQHVAAFFKLETADLNGVPAAVVNLVPSELARKYRVCPIREEDRRLVVATSDPTDLDAEHAIGFACGRTPVFAVAAPDLLDKAIERHYAPERAVTGLLERVGRHANVSVEVVEELEPELVAAEDTEAAPVIKLTNLVLREAVLAGASDIHIESGRSGGTVRFRVDGVLRQYMNLPMAALMRVVSRIKVLAKLDIADRIRPQDGRARIQIQNHPYDLRLSTVPTRDGEKAVIRVLDPNNVLSLDDLTMSGPEMERFRRLLGFRDGLVIVTGPTGSGKTTTLYAGISEINTGEQNIMTVEDPVEYDLASVNQIQVSVKQGVTFASALRAILRQDPDVIFVGEIRDDETARIAIQACMTGHLVLATLHTNDAMGVIPRLVDLGVERSSLAATFRGVIAQRLIRKLCAKCAEDVGDELTEEELELSVRHKCKPVKREVGCKHCGGTGFRGRMPASEVVVATSELVDLIGKNATAVELQSVAMAEGARSMRDSALDAVQSGLTTLAEVERVLGESTTRLSKPKKERGILLVEDDPVTRKVARRHLEKEGYTVTEAVDGQEALERLAVHTDYSLMVLDLEMPRLGGREVLTEVRTSLPTASLPVIVLTAASDSETEASLMEEGADDYISKPIDPKLFIARVKGALRRAAVA